MTTSSSHSWNHSAVLWQDVGEDLNEKFNYTQNVTRSLYDNSKEEVIT